MLRPTIRNRILGIALGLILLMAITSALSTVMTRKIAHQLDELSSKYVETYGHLARMNVRSLEQALALRRMVISRDAIAARRGRLCRTEEALRGQGDRSREGSASRAHADQCDHRRRCHAIRQRPTGADRRSHRKRHHRSSSLSDGRIQAAIVSARCRQFCGSQSQPCAIRHVRATNSRRRSKIFAATCSRRSVAMRR